MSSIETKKKTRVNSAFKQLMSIHWWMAVCYLFLFAAGSIMTRLPGEIAFQGWLVDFHKSMGILVIALLSLRILVLLRVWWRKYTRIPPRFTPVWFRVVALHAVLYLFMWIVPTTGVLFANSIQSHNVVFFGISVPDVFPPNLALVATARSLHFWFAYTLLAFIILHLLEQQKVVHALWRRFICFIKQTRQSGSH
jgi:cytochrome b561